MVFEAWRAAVFPEADARFHKQEAFTYEALADREVVSLMWARLLRADDVAIAIHENVIDFPFQVLADELPTTYDDQSFTTTSSISFPCRPRQRNLVPDIWIEVAGRPALITQSWVRRRLSRFQAIGLVVWGLWSLALRAPTLKECKLALQIAMKTVRKLQRKPRRHTTGQEYIDHTSKNRTLKHFNI